MLYSVFPEVTYLSFIIKRATPETGFQKKYAACYLKGRFFFYEGFGHSDDGLEQRFHGFLHGIRLVTCDALDRGGVNDLKSRCGSACARRTEGGRQKKVTGNICSRRRKKNYYNVNIEIVISIGKKIRIFSQL